MKKYIPLLVLFLGFIIMPKNVFAQSKILLQDSSGNTLSNITNMGENSVNVPNVKYILFYFDIDVSSDSKYNLKAQWSFGSQTSSVQRPTLSWFLLNGSNTNFTHSLGINQETTYGQSTYHWYTDSINFSTNSGTYGTTQVQLTYTLPSVVRIVQINWHDKSLTYLGGTGTDTNSTINSGVNNIINNQNNNTNQIINNQNNNTNSINNNINEIEDNLTDDNVDESSDKAQDFFNDFDVGDTGNLTDIISLPLDFLDSLNNQCTPISLTLPKMGNITIPCVQSYVSQFIPNELINLIKLAINGYFIYKILSSLIDFINTLKDPNNDDLEVMDL